MSRFGKKSDRASAAGCRFSFGPLIYSCGESGPRSLDTAGSPRNLKFVAASDGVERTITMRKVIALFLVASLLAPGCRSYAPTASKGKNTEMPKSGGAPKPADDKPQNTD